MLQNQRIGVFVDVQNMFYAARNQHNARLNYGKLLDWVVGDRQLVRAVAYLVRSPEVDQSKFVNMLRSLLFEVRIKDLRVRPDGSTKGDWGLGIAIDTLSLADRLDVVCLVTGDGDFVDLVHMLKALGVRVEIYSFRPSTAEELVKAATAFIEIEPEMLIKPAEGRGR
jgi:uncharacterized LabA/DUF88 family protein